MSLRLQKHSFRFAEQVLHSKLSQRKDIEKLLLRNTNNLQESSKPKFNKNLIK